MTTFARPFWREGRGGGGGRGGFFALLLEILARLAAFAASWLGGFALAPSSGCFLLFAGLVFLCLLAFSPRGVAAWLLGCLSFCPGRFVAFWFRRLLELLSVV